jgi:ABC-2 type transport system ATP-binding protein
MYAIETHNLTKKYGEKVVVNHVNLKVKKGSIFGFLGKNGAGKSTFINMITGLCIPSSGTFTLRVSSNNVKSKIGVLPDYSAFYDDLTALEHMNYFSKILNLKLSKNEMIRLLEYVGLGDAAKVKVKKYSFGMKKKLGIAQALLNNPEILFLDEPTSGVDADSILTIHTLIRNISKDGTTIFLTSHNLNEVEKLCNEIAIMDKGEIRVQGNIDSLKRSFQENITVTIKCGKISTEKYKELNDQLNLIGNSIQWEKDQVSLIVKDESVIPIVNKLFVNMNVDVFRIQVYEPTLEEIFLRTGEQ